MDEHDADDRRTAVLDAALTTFARYGYRRTSMEEVAQAARISRPGLYFLFSSKAGLFRAAAERAVGRDLTAAEEALADLGRPLADRVVRAFDHWAGRYTGPLQDAAAVMADNPELAGPVVQAAPARFAAALTAALQDSGTPRAAAVARTLISVSAGLVRQVDTREEYLSRLAEALDLLVRPD